MTRMVAAFLLCGFCWALSPPVVIAEPAGDQRPVLRTGFVEFPPYNYVGEDGNAAGSWVEMTEQVATQAGYQIEWVYLPIARVYLYLRQGKIDLWPGVADIPMIAGSVYESSVTPMRVVLYAFHQKGVEAPPDLDFLVGKPLILINGFSYMGVLKHLPLEDKHLSEAPNHHAALRMLKLERGRYVLSYDAPIEAIAGSFSELELTGTPIFTARGAFVVSRFHPDAKTIVGQFNEAYVRLVESGQLTPLP
jgi:polar amino acid transport system substrate-binding protein